MMKKTKRSTALICAAAMCMAAMPSSVFAAESTITRYEAESASLSGISTETDSSCSGGKCVVFESAGSCTFSIDAPSAGYYDLNFFSAGIGGEKYNDAAVDGTSIGQFTSVSEKMSDAKIGSVYMDKGRHTVSVTPSWGWIRLDYLELEFVPESFDVEKVYKVDGKLSNPNASESAKKLMKFICDNYGKNVISGQQCDGMNSAEYKAVQKATGKSPAMIGFDLMDYTPSRIKKGASKSKAVENAIEFSEAGGIVTMCWHWNAPEKFVKQGNDKNGNPAWWGGFYTDNVTGLKLSKILDNPNGNDYKLFMQDIDAIAEQLKILKENDVPVLFRPLHEASGGWFWWGSDGAEAYKKLYRILYKKLTKEHGLNNLIWVWNGQAKEWYPGDEYVDIIGEDIYPGKHQYGAQSSKFIEAAQYSSANKVVALSENGCLFDIDEAKKAGTMWSWFCVWSGEFCVGNNNSVSDEYTEKTMWKKVYNHSNVLTLDDTSKLFKKSVSYKISDAAVTIPKKTYSYTGKAVKPVPTVKYNGKTLKKGTDYTVEYKNNIKVGKAYLIIKGKGKYSGTVKIYFSIKSK